MGQGADKMISLNKRTVYVNKPRWMDNRIDMGHKLIDMLEEQEMLGRLIQKITIEVDELTRIDYIILPGRWIDRLYDNGMLKRGTL